jgi:hypothetical protein
MGQRVLETKRRTDYRDFVQDDLFLEWRAGALSFLKAVFGEDSTHFTEMRERCKHSWHSDAVEGQAIMKAASTDLKGGYLKRIEDLVSADVFSDFLEMAAYLLEQGYKDPAASLVGAVLEDGLRRIAKATNTTLKSREDISSLSKKLADGQIYNRMMQKQIEVWSEIRNNADHGHFDQYVSQDVKGMLDGVRSFLAQHL